MKILNSLALSTFIGISLMFVSPTVAGPAAKIVPLLRPPMNQIVQPFIGEVKFTGSPGYAQVCSVTVNLTCLRKLETAECFRLEKTGVYGFAVTPDSINWDAPIDSGANIEFLCTFRPGQVGTYQLTLGRKLKQSRHSLASLILAIDEDGKTVYAGAAKDYRLNLIPPHPKRDSNPLIISFPLKGTKFDPGVDRHFSADFKFSGPPQLNDTITVAFILDCHFDLYSKVQFVLEHSTNLKPSELPQSWGDNVKPDGDYRYYKGKFSFVPLKPGIGVLTFRIVGKRPGMKQSDRVTTEFPIYYVISDDNQLLFIGDFDPWTRFKDKADPLLGTLSRLLDVKNRDYTLKHVLSQPDYLGDEIKAQESGDSAGSHK